MIKKFAKKYVIISRLINLRTEINEIINELERDDDEYIKTNIR